MRLSKKLAGAALLFTASSAFAAYAVNATMTAPPQGPGTVQVSANAPRGGISAGASLTLGSAQPQDAVDKCAAIRSAVDAARLQDVAVIFGNADGEVCRYKKGAIEYNQKLALASATKLLTGILSYRMIQAGKITATSKPQQYFGYWTNSASDNRSKITLEQLLAFTSGFNTKDTNLLSCVYNKFTTLDLCIRRIYNGNIDSVPGAVYFYGPHHMQVAAGMLDAADTGDFGAIFARYVTTPLGLTDTSYALQSAANPWAAAGGESTANDYAVIMRALFNGQLVTNLDNFFAPRTLTATKGEVPAAVLANNGSQWEYAQGSWVECEYGTGGANYATQCATDKINSSPGAWGFTPWIDRKNGYWAVIATEDHSSGAEKGIELEQVLQPLMVAALLL
ncbi:serine hydrolase [Sphingomonas sp. AOB5]|uniref:serine hydrolase n=1 Tax=Sphingomonas sp. AOB5 TaxID=3034017 RepID=UPI0023F79FF3|nr:serine hydrolase [Sphingomonas sp. AOB5]MDF7774794.1 serine hydrolase [Sphingomonas sp. AOB5]